MESPWSAVYSLTNLRESRRGGGGMVRERRKREGGERVGGERERE